MNPNIQPRGEYDKRAAELNKLIRSVHYPNAVEAVVCDYDNETFITATAPFRDEPEGGRRCRSCFELRLRETAKYASGSGCDYFATTLTVSPHKDADLINEIGAGLAPEFGVSYLISDFKKHDGFKRSIELSKQYGLYRQQYCGCMPCPGNRE